jgi:hypothetical protein
MEKVRIHEEKASIWKRSWGWSGIRVLGSIENYLELGFGKEGDSKALVLELLEGVKEDRDASVRGSYGFMQNCVN